MTHDEIKNELVLLFVSGATPPETVQHFSKYGITEGEVSDAALDLLRDVQLGKFKAEDFPEVKL